ncbi:MAG: methyltransferase domain-containing protein [Candidatus Competibacteraceae bacterium]
MTQEILRDDLPGQGLDPEKMPGHWLLAQMGKRVLRPSGLELTQKMLADLKIQADDAVVEFAPGLGVTARLALERQPASYIGIERNDVAAQQVRRYLSALNRQCLVGVAEETGLPDRSATVVYGEAMLTMQTPDKKIQIVREAARLLKPGGRYGIHELCLQPDDLPDSKKEAISRALSETIRIGARPLTVAEWKTLLEAEGFTIASQVTAPMHLLEPKRLIQDEGFGGFLRFVWNVVRNPVARRRILGMRAIFRSHAESLCAMTMVGVKQETVAEPPVQNLR